MKKPQILWEDAADGKAEGRKLTKAGKCGIFVMYAKRGGGEYLRRPRTRQNTSDVTRCAERDLKEEKKICLNF